jgi:RNA-binding protein YhbY
MKRHVRYKLKDENPTIWIGKDGLTPQLSNEIENQLEKKKMLKIKSARASKKCAGTLQCSSHRVQGC